MEESDSINNLRNWYKKSVSSAKRRLCFTTIGLGLSVPAVFMAYNQTIHFLKPEGYLGLNQDRASLFVETEKRIRKTENNIGNLNRKRQYIADSYAALLREITDEFGSEEITSRYGEDYKTIDSRIGREIIRERSNLNRELIGLGNNFNNVALANREIGKNVVGYFLMGSVMATAALGMVAFHSIGDYHQAKRMLKTLQDKV